MSTKYKEEKSLEEAKEKMKSMDFEDLPLYVGSDNKSLKKMVSKKLKGEKEVFSFFVSNDGIKEIKEVDSEEAINDIANRLKSGKGLTKK